MTVEDFHEEFIATKSTALASGFSLLQSDRKVWLESGCSLQHYKTSDGLTSLTSICKFRIIILTNRIVKGLNDICTDSSHLSNT